jgi:hypothetical protein
LVQRPSSEGLGNVNPGGICRGSPHGLWHITSASPRNSEFIAAGYESVAWVAGCGVVGLGNPQRIAEVPRGLDQWSTPRVPGNTGALTDRRCRCFDRAYRGLDRAAAPGSPQFWLDFPSSLPRPFPPKVLSSVLFCLPPRDEGGFSQSPHVVYELRHEKLLHKSSLGPSRDPPPKPSSITRVVSICHFLNPFQYDAQPSAHMLNIL